MTTTTDTTDRRYHLHFDTSVTGAGALVSRQGNDFALITYRQFRYGTAAGDRALAELFADAQNTGATVSAEEPQGRDRQGTSIRRSTHGWVMVLKEMTRHAGLTWGGSIHPGTAKKAMTGDGAARKEKVILFVKLRFGLDLTPKQEHTADAIAGAVAALQGHYLQRKKKQRTLPGTVTQAIAKARKPDPCKT
jgi:hypothetical protein